MTVYIITNKMINNTEQSQIYSVSKLTREIKELIEDKFPFIWLTGEISNLSKPASGHCYFTLKDSKSQISSVLFRGQSQNLNFVLKNGMQITGFGRIALYEPRGSYQIIFEYLKQMGSGSLQIAFEQLKNQLANEGLFDIKYKTPLPFLPRKVSIITSPTGAVIHDFISIASRRFQNIHVNIIPVTVQGKDATKKIVNAIQFANNKIKPDIIVLARGGGSLEDMQPFNSEEVARKIYTSQIPIVSAVGHETDYTIADFTADFRAPTPSNAAEIIFPEKLQLQKKIDGLNYLLTSSFKRYINNKRYHIESISQRLIHPKKRLEDMKLKTDDLLSRLNRAIHQISHQHQEKLKWKISSLHSVTPRKNIKKHLHNNNNFQLALKTGIIFNIKEKKMKMKELSGRLNALNPNAILNRGYSITRTIPEANIITDTSKIQKGQLIEVLLSKGRLKCKVEEK